MTDGTVAGTFQAEVGRSERRFREGTYAARIRFSDAPLEGQRGDRVVQTFFAIGPPLARPLDPAYSELDFEYLPNGGWGTADATMFMTSWETYQEDPLVEKLTHTLRPGSLSGWHTLVIQVGRGDVRYFIDGQQHARHGGRSYPDSLMSIVFNLWFQDGGLLPGGTAEALPAGRRLGLPAAGRRPLAQPGAGAGGAAPGCLTLTLRRSVRAERASRIRSGASPREQLAESQRGVDERVHRDEDGEDLEPARSQDLERKEDPRQDRHDLDASWGRLLAGRSSSLPCARWRCRTAT